MKRPSENQPVSVPVDGQHPLVTEVARQMGELLRRRLEPGLHIVATPIGNLFDVSLRLLWAIETADFVYCEDTRHTRNLLTRFGITRGLRSYHDHSGAAEREAILELLAAGKSVALLSDAGTPLISDPGFKLVRTALEAGHKVAAVPGPSAALAALSISGLATDSFLFAGFLPPKQNARRQRLEELAGVRASLVLFEAPNRLGATLAEMAGLLGNRQAAVAREITKLNEELVVGTLGELAAWAEREPVKGEVTVVVGPQLQLEASDGDIEERLRLALDAMSVRDAARAVADELGVAKGRVYDLAVALRRGRQGSR
ncbi:MAG: hypothetical protein RLZ98_757 [Pseudomonadota bacterium]|jgi:16S rRNA (cytidine1402-2'-O)-methyltransferase